MAVIVVLNLLAYWIVTGPWIPPNQFAAILVGGFFMGSSVGTFWMMFVAIRYESKPWHFIWLALIPFCFVWYYFERFRSGKHLTRSSASGTS